MARTDKGGEWLLKWAIDEYTDKENLKHKIKYQQVWGLNKEGKVNFMEQFDRDFKMIKQLMSNMP